MELQPQGLGLLDGMGQLAVGLREEQTWVGNCLELLHVWNCSVTKKKKGNFCLERATKKTPREKKSCFYKCAEGRDQRTAANALGFTKFPLKIPLFLGRT